jgi:hypothetical protein
MSEQITQWPGTEHTEENAVQVKEFGTEKIAGVTLAEKEGFAQNPQVQEILEAIAAQVEDRIDAGFTREEALRDANEELRSTMIRMLGEEKTAEIISESLKESRRKAYNNALDSVMRVIQIDNLQKEAGPEDAQRYMA